MTEQSPVLVKTTAGIVGYYVIVEVTVTTNDTFKVKELSSINGVVALKMADWSAVSCSATGNTVTVDQAGLIADKIVALVGGQK